MAFRQVLDNDTNMKSVICYFKCLPSSTKEADIYICLLSYNCKAQHQNAS